MSSGPFDAGMRTLVIAMTLVLASIGTGSPVAGAAGATIQPGIEILSGGSQCTLAWIFDDESTGKVYASTAAHCVSGVGATVSHRGYGNFGTVAWKSPTLDFILIEIYASKTSNVDGELKGHPGYPAGLATSSNTSARTDVCQFSGYGTGYRYTDVTQEERFGLLTFNDGAQHYCQFPVTPGDSGGPVAIQRGKLALGVVNTVGFACCQNTLVHVGEGGASLQRALVQATAAGYDLDLRLA